ncbi:hypothetical protein TURU_017962 [Turdus rufiventris]|nr:hypothetical protein TURU_017962 [Turdus rufiventris]
MCDPAADYRDPPVKQADDTKPNGAVDRPEGQDAIQTDLDVLQKWVHGNLMRLNKAKCKTLYLGQPGSNTSWGINGWRADLWRKTWAESCSTWRIEGSEEPYSTFQYLKGAYKGAEERIFTSAGSDRTGDNGLKLREDTSIVKFSGHTMKG